MFFNSKEIMPFFAAMSNKRQNNRTFFLRRKSSCKLNLQKRNSYVTNCANGRELNYDNNENLIHLFIVYDNWSGNFLSFQMRYFGRINAKNGFNRTTSFWFRHSCHLRCQLAPQLTEKFTI